MRTLRILLLSAGLLFLGVVFYVGYVIFFRPMTLPIYRFAQQPSQYSSAFTASTLSFGGDFYLHDITEESLEITANSTGWMSQVGRTEDGLEVHRIPQQDPQKYLMLTTEMFPNLIFRNIHEPAIQPNTLPFTALQFKFNLGNGPQVVSSEDPDLIREVTNIFASHQEAVKLSAPSSSGILLLTSNQLPGLAYVLYASANPEGQVFLAEKRNPEEWISCGPSFRIWFNQAVSK